ncbi:MAG: hypothetical protein KA059_07760 [Elusimicrobiales bacterium]|jgi:hypothetical protein|nr:hypothetical protein [Elusimicrobiales bacterium]
MENNQNSTGKTDNSAADTKHNEEELESLKKKNKFLKIIVISFSIVIILFFIFVAVAYYNYKKITNAFKAATENYQTEEEINPMGMIQYDTVTINNIQYQQSSTSSLSMIGFTKDIVENSKSETTQSAVEDMAEQYQNDKNIKKFIEKMKNDPDFKDILQSSEKERPIKFMKKMQDPKFMQKMANEFISNPELMQSIINMSTDPRMQSVMKNAPEEMKKLKASTSTIKTK